MVRVLSFDVGVKNLALCDLIYNTESRTTTITNWTVLNISNEAKSTKYDIGQVCENLMHALLERYQHTEGSNDIIDVVLIENQPVIKNPIMKSIQIMIYTFFMLRKTAHQSVGAVKLVSARNKLKLVDFIDDKEKRQAMIDEAEEKAKCKTGYKYNKKLAILLAKHFLEVTSVSDDVQLEFQKSKKQDDLSDTFCQALHYIFSI